MANNGKCVMSIKKIKSTALLNGAYKHNAREYTPANVDGDLTYLNDIMIDSKETYKEAVTNAVEKAQKEGTMGKIRSNAVLAGEIVMELTNESIQNGVDVEAWKQDCKDWMLSHFGEKNVKHMVCHMDEPGSGGVHIHAFFVPMNEKGRLSYKSFIDGPYAMAKLQESYKQEVGNKYGLNYAKQSVAKHQDIKKFYSKINDCVVTKESLMPKADEVEGERILPCYFDRVANELETNNFKHMQEIENLKQETIDFKNNNLETEMEMRRLKKEYEQKLKKVNKLLYQSKKEIQNEDITISEFERRLKTINALQKGLQNYPDENIVRQTAENIDAIVAYQREQDKEKDKEIDKRLGL